MQCVSVLLLLISLSRICLVLYNHGTIVRAWIGCYNTIRVILLFHGFTMVLGFRTFYYSN